MASQQQNFTIGVEEEYQIVDPSTRQLCPSSLQLLPAAQQQLGERVGTEICLTQLEVSTPVCSTLQEVRQSLQHARRILTEIAWQEGKQVFSAGLHPFSHWSEQPLTPAHRYQELERIYQHLAREQAVCGYHIHVGMHNRELALRIVNRMRPWLPVLLALSASSPFWLGNDTGYASFRTLIWSRWPLSGPPPQFSSLEEHEMLMRALVATGAMADPTFIYWDARLSVRYPTIEVRVADACLTVDEAVMLAGLTRALVWTCYEQELQHLPLLDVRFELLRLAHWQAARYGLCGALLDLEEQCLLPAAVLVDKFLYMVRAALERQGEWGIVSALVHSIIYEGNGAARMRAMYQRSQRYADVVDLLVEEMVKGVF
ncbi:MAG TPA: glutamate--cysteine ligase [Ktedonobacteraceae bacterium]